MAHLSDALASKSFSQRSLAELPHALQDGDPSSAIQASLIQHLSQRHLLLFLDYDGTLTPIVDRPQDAVLDDAGRAALAAVCAVFPTAVISGRDRADVEALVALPGLIYAGSHGFDVDLPDHPTLAPQPPGAAELLDQVQGALTAAIGAIPGALIERKAVSIAAHYRLVADADQDSFQQAVDGILAQFPQMHEKPGKKVREMLPAADWDKGLCVLALLRALGRDDADHLALFIGDDRTDEDAFAALHSRGAGGVSVVVADPREPENTGRQTYADYRLDSPAQVLTLLDKLPTAFTQK